MHTTYWLLRENKGILSLLRHGEQSFWPEPMKKRELRRNVSVAAEMRLEGERLGVRVMNISARGMLVRCGATPVRGDYVDITRGSQRVIGRVVWSKDGKFGLRTQDRIDVDAFIDPESGKSSKASAHEIDASHDRALATAEQCLARSQHFSAVLQFGFLAIGVVAAAALLAHSVHDLLGASLGQVAEALSGNR